MCVLLGDTIHQLIHPFVTLNNLSFKLLERIHGIGSSEVYILKTFYTVPRVISDMRKEKKKTEMRYPILAPNL